jgi:hypothetical protein
MRYSLAMHISLISSISSHTSAQLKCILPRQMMTINIISIKCYDMDRSGGFQCLLF